ncbi:MAG: histidine kinase dimerization/phosphoacceptor domain -containing protein [Planctomycetota bacterium]|nr:histidine kinase dimerization/phosphoacceptor domain -containing protein [Planctomycetota bacterium]
MLAAKSLRLRLTLAFSAMVALIALVGWVSYATHDRVRADVRELRASDVFDLNSVDLAHTGLEIEGFWNPAGSFIATDIEPKPPQQPRLRGAVQSVDRQARTLQIYGVDVVIADETEDGADFDQVQPGQRVEVSCTVDAAGKWVARKLYTRDIKTSDKVKGMVTEKRFDGRIPESILIHGLEIIVEPSRGGGADSALQRIEQATQMILTLQECRALANDLVGDVAVPGSGDRNAGLRLEAAMARFREILREAYGEGGDRGAVPTDTFRRYLDQLTEQSTTLSRLVGELNQLATQGDGAAVLSYLDQEFDPFLNERVMPVLVSYLGEGREELGDQLRGMLDRTEATTRFALGASVVAVIAALLLGFLVWRSIHGPVRRMHDAALRLGQGHLDTRIEIRRRDELGVLAEAFNRMASDLATTTISRESLESVFDSMAASVIVCDADGRIINTNQATRQLLARGQGELLGRRFDAICKFAEDEPVVPLVTWGRGEDSEVLGTIERVFVRSDGVEFPVSLSGAELRSAGELHGYVCVAQDLSEQKRTEGRIRQSLAEKELLLREVHHRLKNNMQVISSLLAMQTNDGDTVVARRLQESQNRIRTIALIHEQLYQSTELARIDIQNYLHVLTNHLLLSFDAHETVQLDLQIEKVGLNIDQSLSIGLIVNELMTNSLKYAFVDEGGRITSGPNTVRIALSSLPGGSHVLEVADNGRGLSGAPPPEGPTLGASLVKTLARQLQGTVEVDGTQGTTTRIVFGGGAAEEAGRS